MERNHWKKLAIGVVIALGLADQVTLLAGDLTTRSELTLDRVLSGGPPTYSDDFVLADAVPQHVRRFTEFSGDVSGRYLGALATVAQWNGKKFPGVDRIASMIVPLQKPDGHFGDPFSTKEVTNSDMALMWGNGRLLIGLLEYYRLNPKPEILACARRLGDCFVNLGPRFNDPAIVKQFSGEQIAVGYICWTQIIEGLVELNRVTHDEKYLSLARQIAENTRRHPHQHSHGFVSALRGILELYRATNDAQWLKKVESEWEGVIASGNLLPQGALPEVFKPLVPTPHDEGCSEADWLRLNLGLWAETRNLRYLENAELTLFNEFYFNQFHTGDFGHHTFSDEGYTPGSARAWWCCTFHGLRAFPDVSRAAFHAGTDALCYDLPVDGRIAADGLTLQADSTLEQNSTVTLTADEADGAEHTLRLRLPAWASALELKLNGRSLAGNRTDGGVEIRRRWTGGDKLEVRYMLRTRLQVHPQDPKRFAILRGPWFLGVDEQDVPTFFDEPKSNNRVLLPARDANGDVPLATVVEKNAGAKIPFIVPVAHLALDYLPGGYPIQPQTVTLRPIAEQTSIADGTPWIFWFESKK